MIAPFNFVWEPFSDILVHSPRGASCRRARYVLTHVATMKQLLTLPHTAPEEPPVEEPGMSQPFENIGMAADLLVF